MKVISGGQTGVDQAALRAAKAHQLETGGWAPRGYRTLDGCTTTLRTIYGLEEHESEHYAPRTEANVQASDGTLVIVRFKDSAGERCTMRAINKHDKPFCLVTDKQANAQHVFRVVAWIKKHNIQTLNVAGNSELTAPGIGGLAYDFLKQVFAVL